MTREHLKPTAAVRFMETNSWIKGEMFKTYVRSSRCLDQTGNLSKQLSPLVDENVQLLPLDRETISEVRRIEHRLNPRWLQTATREDALVAIHAAALTAAHDLAVFLIADDPDPEAIAGCASRMTEFASDARLLETFPGSAADWLTGNVYRWAQHSRRIAAARKLDPCVVKEAWRSARAEFPTNKSKAFEASGFSRSAIKKAYGVTSDSELP